MRNLNVFIITTLLAGLAANFASADLVAQPSESSGGSNNPFGPVIVAPLKGPFDPALGPWKWNADVGGGSAIVSGSQGNLRGGYNFQLGGGYNFNSQTGLTLEYLDSGLGVTNQAMNANGAIDGWAHVWALTLNPVWRYKIGGIVGGYIIGGGGYYARELHFTEPFQETSPGLFQRTNIDRTDNTGGVDLGAGFTFNVGYGTKIFIEARYHYLFTPGYATQLIPITLGLRW
jgi:hypothetical protein